MMSITQPTLNLLPRPYLGFDNFYIEPDNEALLFALKNWHRARTESSFPSHPITYIWGNEGCGKTHLLNAIGETFYQKKQPLFYFSCEESNRLEPHLFDHLEGLHGILLDNIHLLNPSPHWQEAFFHFLNRLAVKDSHCFISAQCPIKQLNLLPDICSRLASGAIYQVATLSEQGISSALKLRAAGRGLQLTDQAIAYILSRSRRDATTLFNQFDQLDQAAWNQQRKLTVPFIKNIMGW